MTSSNVPLAEVSTISRVIARAKEVMDPAAYAWTFSGAGEGATALRNNAALDRLALVPSIMNDVSSVVTTTSFLGVPLSMPVLVAPVGSTAMFHPTTRWRWPEVLRRPAPPVSVETRRPHCGATWQRSLRDDISISCTSLGTATGHRGSSTLSSRRLRRSLRHRRRSGACSSGPLDRVGTRLESGTSRPDQLSGPRLDRSFKTTFTWPELEWLCGRTALPVILKGVMRPAEASRALEAGVSAIYVSNHGGRSMDHGISTIEVLEEIVTAVGPEVEVVVDSGFTRGAEVCKALALGARAVGIGKFQCRALALGGAPALAHVLGILLTRDCSHDGHARLPGRDRDHGRSSAGRSPLPPVTRGGESVARLGYLVLVCFRVSAPGE